jgi:hypothetical protein
VAWRFKRARHQSLTTRVLVPTAIAAALLTIVGTALTYIAVHAAEAQAARAALVTHASERARRESRRFADIAALHDQANGAFAQSLRALDRGRAEAEFDRLFPLQPDGTRRSSDALFAGHATDDGHHVYGIGAFIADGRNLSRDEKAELMAALRVVSRFGDAVSFRFDNFFFYGPGNRAIVFSPKRPERLAFFRKHAPANFSIAFDDLGQIALPAVNPEGEMRCARPRRPLYDNRSSNWMISCLTPVRIDGAHVGAWGVALQVEQLVGADAERRMPGTEHMMLTGDGKLLAHRFGGDGGVESSRGYLDIARSGDARLARVAQLADDARGGARVAYSAADDHFIAAAPLRGPDWRFVVMADGGEVRRRAVAVTLKVLAIVTAGATATMLLLHHLLKTQIAQPLKAIADGVDRQRGQPLAEREALRHVLPIRRRDEIGAIARRLARVDDPAPDSPPIS